MKKISMGTIVGIFVVVGLVCVAYMRIKMGKLNI